jgi:hypothetical protein
MPNPVLLVQNAGYGETPPCPQALFRARSVVRLRRRKHLAHLPEKGAVAAVVPPGFPADYALADLRKEPRPLMVTRERRAVTYIVLFEGNPTPHLLRESDLLPTDEPLAEITIEGPPAGAPK